MKLNFRKDIVTSIPTSYLIEDFNGLRNAIKNEDWQLVDTVADCLASIIDSCTYVPADLQIKPSVSSLIDPDNQNGILLEGKKDVLCENGKPISMALDGGIFQCDEECPYFKTGECDPEGSQVLLKGHHLWLTGRDGPAYPGENQYEQED